MWSLWGKRYERKYRSADKYDPSRFALQGHWRSSEPTRISYDYDRVTYDLLLVILSNDGA